MILSYHPCVEVDKNILCAGREPDTSDVAAIRKADAVILPQGCRPALYRLAREHCPHVFPNYDARFDYPGKTGQARLFDAVAAPHPRTWVFDNTVHFQQTAGCTPPGGGFPLVFKLDWGGEGETVFLLSSPADLSRALQTAAAYERSGQQGFVIQAFVGPANRTLRVVVVGETRIAYWRVQNDPFTFGSSLAQGASIDADSDPELRQQALDMVQRFCGRTGINLAGFDLLFDDGGIPQAFFLEINYFFGRTGLGGSERFYTLLRSEIDRWLAGLGVASGRM